MGGTGTLHLVGTPIGNLGDMTDRAREALAAVDLVACEDTRRTRQLLTAFGISARTISFFEGNERERTARVLDELRRGRDVALVSEAGMPGLSDPGFGLVRACAEEGIDVRVVPGPSAVVAALVVSGLPTDRFAYEGFPPRRRAERRARLEALGADPRTIVFFESPRRLAGFLRDVRDALGDRRVAVARELTKVHEEVIRGSVSEVLAEVEARGVRGEIVVVVEGAVRQAPSAGSAALVEEARALIRGGMRKREAATEVARRHGASANALYRSLLEAERRAPTRR